MVVLGGGAISYERGTPEGFSRTSGRSVRAGALHPVSVSPQSLPVGARTVQVLALTQSDLVSPIR